jgi:hypothetical protein
MEGCSRGQFFRRCLDICMEGLLEAMNNLIHDSRSPNRYLNSRPLHKHVRQLTLGRDVRL